ncbi:MAG: TIGR04086 family membrane protein [Defluviitaleaceae bacterium]|nr:TIGR04086 family membrane protein [Defluviitaleaceae bacterium]
MPITKMQIKHLTLGVLIAYAITAIVFLGYAILITYTNVSERSLPMVIAITTVLSVMVAGFDAARAAETRGWLWGMIAGLVYVLILAGIMLVFLPGFPIDSRTVIVCALGIAGGGLGGVFGINLKR